MSDIVRITVKKGGAIEIQYGKVDQVHHKQMEDFQAAIEKMAGGKTITTKGKQAQGHHHGHQTHTH